MKWQASLAKWRDDRHIGIQSEATFESMMAEELQEYRVAVANDDWHEQVDAICDQVVLTTNHLAYHPDREDLKEALADLLTLDLPNLGVVPDLAMKQCLKEISSRVQDPIQAAEWSNSGATGKWQKDLNQDPSTLYKADYKLAKCRVIGHS